AQTKHLHYKQSVFVSILAHDLKNLIIGLRNNIDNIRSENTVNKNQHLTQKLDMAQKQVSESKLLLENVLCMAQPNDFELHPEYTSLSVKQLFNKMYLHEIEAREKKLELIFKYDYDFNFIADQVMIDSVLRNLITNAIQNTSKGNITVCAEEESRNYKFSVIDTGCGIKQELQNQLFLTRIKHSNDNNTAVSGFGLMVSKKLITAHRGSINFSSKQGSGSTFWFTIPKKSSYEGY
ncbi:MAG: HAMP domain-containing histidine kinase, partial [Bacteroidales bacterium]|nr:HAMP domain-containing histidine kinase [Bacteroidales bacterium]